MLNDPISSLMLMLLLCFMGMAVMFLFVMRSLSSIGAQMREELTRQQMYLADMETQIRSIQAGLRRLNGEPDLAGGGDAFSFLERKNTLMTMLDDAAIARESPSGNPETEEEYDPLRDPHLFEEELLASPDAAKRPRPRPSRAGALNLKLGG